MLGDLLGRGGMAEVFSGYVIGSHGFQKPVAIKRLLPELANDHVFVERLIGEAKLLVGMQHGNIVSVLDLARDGDDVFLVMEFVDGPSLRQLLKARGSRRLSLGTATYIVQAAAAGLELAHARPGGAVIHADISPSNLLLTTSGEVRVADFGIARREGGGAGVVEGKWAYMAPEQARGEPLTPRSDVFAVGVVLYELITGHHPLGQRITPDERDSGPIRIAPPRVINPAVPAGLETICMKALADQARDRYARMQQLIDALIDERFANQWRDGASDLAQVIRAITPGGAPVSAGPRTQVTDHPVTIMTRSLISQPHRLSSPVIAPSDDSVDTLEQVSHSQPSAARTSVIEMRDAAPASRGSVPLIPSSGARTAIVEMPVVLSPGLPASPLPPTLRIDGTPPNAYELLPSLLPGPELASVHGGATVTGAAGYDARDARINKWTVAVFGLAALLGVIAVIAIRLAPSDADAEPSDPIVHLGVTPTVQAPAETSSLAAAIPAETAPAPTVTASPPADPPSPAEVETVATPSERVPAAARDPAPSSRKPRPSAAGKKNAAAADATLRVNTYDGTWAFAYVNGQRDYVPGAKFKLVPGRYTVRLTNPDLHINRTCQINIGSGEVMTLKVELEEGGCEVSKY